MLNVKMAFQSIKKDQILTDLNTFSAFFFISPKELILTPLPPLKKRKHKNKEIK